jgi:DNA-binding CsgD family transcriptional regulator
MIKKVKKKLKHKLDKAELELLQSEEIQLWQRRFNEARLFARGIPITEIARTNNLTRQTIYNDLIEYQKLMIELEKSGIKQEIIICEEVIREAFSVLAKVSDENAFGKAAMMNRILEAVKELGILRGRRNPDGSGNIINPTQINIENHGDISKILMKKDKNGKTLAEKLRSLYREHDIEPGRSGSGILDREKTNS